MKSENEQFIAALLAEIKRLSDILDIEEQKYQQRIENVKRDHLARTAMHRHALERVQEHLLTGLKQHKNDIFPGKTDRIAIAGGVILRQIALVVRKARHITVDFLRTNGKTEGIRIEEHVDWQKIDSWTDDQLALIGTERKKKETFAYELL
jgi:hypothetical protein